MISTARVFVSAPAKINLCLHVGARRADGYHDLESLVVFSALGDEIELTAAKEFSLAIEGPFAAAITADSTNLALRAARDLAAQTGVKTGARIRLRKNIPVAAGLGGGSADAAAVLRGLARLWDLDHDSESLPETAASIGADVPVCVESATSWMAGRGERVTPLPALPEGWLLLVNPGIAVSTAQVFAALQKRRGTGMEIPHERFEDVFALARFLEQTGNDLELPARAIAPVIGDVIEEMTNLSGVLLARMSGSGATCFGLFAEQRLCHEAAERLRGSHPKWWVADTAISTPDDARPRLGADEICRE